MQKKANKEVIEKEINDALERVMTNTEKYSDILRLYAKVLFNLRYDVNELKLELLKVFNPDIEVEHEPIKPEDEVNLYS